MSPVGLLRPGAACCCAVLTHGLHMISDAPPPHQVIAASTDTEECHLAWIK